MSSPFRRHQQMVRGIVSGASPRRSGRDRDAGAPLPAPEGSEYAGLRVLLHDNLRALADIQSHEARQPQKAEFAKAFAPWIEGVLAGTEVGEARQDEILVTNLIWAVDYRDFDYALRLGAHALAHDLVLPQNYTRSVACFLAEDIAQLALQQKELVTHDQLLRLAGLVSGRDMPDPVVARLHKAIGRSFARKAEEFEPAADSAPAGGKSAYLAEALAQLQRALALDANVGVKKDIEALTRALKAAVAAAQA